MSYMICVRGDRLCEGCMRCMPEPKPDLDEYYDDDDETEDEEDDEE